MVRADSPWSYIRCRISPSWPLVRAAILGTPAICSRTTAAMDSHHTRRSAGEAGPVLTTVAAAGSAAIGAAAAALGADAIWLSPIFPSPMADMGYDVSDYRGIDPLFGDMEDFDALIERAHELGLKVIIDQVLSHSSDRHPWFAESRQSRDNDKADWYVWADAKPDGSPPNNWLSIFGGSNEIQKNIVSKMILEL